MFPIRDDQKNALLPDAALRYFPEIKAHILKNYPDKSWPVPEPELDERIRTGIRRAAAYGISELAGIAAFVSLMFDIAPNFDEQPGIARALNNTSLHPNTRMSQLVLDTTEDDWQQAVVRYDPAAWSRATAGAPPQAES